MTVPTAAEFRAQQQAYFDAPGKSRTDLVAFRRCPEKYFQGNVAKTIPPIALSTAILDGSCLDEYITGGILPDDSLPDGVLEGPTDDRRPKAWKEWAAEFSAWPAENLWTGNEAAAYRACVVDRIAMCAYAEKQIHEHEFANSVVFDPHRICQTQYQIECGCHLFPLKNMADIVLPHRKAVIDFKFLKSCHEESWCRDVADRGYDIQAVLGIVGAATEDNLHPDMHALCDQDDWDFEWKAYNVVVENTWPYRVEVYGLAKWLNRARHIIRETVTDLESAMEMWTAKRQPFRDKNHGKVKTPLPPRYLKYRSEYAL